MQTSSLDIKKGSYLCLLKKIEAMLPALLLQPERWQSVDIDYEFPRVERVWTSWESYRIYLHRIHPAESHPTLFHQHPWPSAMRIIKGCYEMGLGYGEDEKPPIMAIIELSESACYEMIHPQGWHYVSPLGDTTYSLMVAGLPWPGRTQSSGLILKPLSESVKLEIMGVFKNFYLSFKSDCS